jgi:hypothetical protein
MNLNYVEVTDVTGRTWRSDTADEEWTTEQREQVEDVLGKFGELDRLRIDIDGASHFFNPAQLIAIAIKAEQR